MIVFTTEHYRKHPLIVRGTGGRGVGDRRRCTVRHSAGGGVGGRDDGETER